MLRVSERAAGSPSQWVALEVPSNAPLFSSTIWPSAETACPRRLGHPPRSSPSRTVPPSAPSCRSGQQRSSGAHGDGGNLHPNIPLRTRHLNGRAGRRGILDPAKNPEFLPVQTFWKGQAFSETPRPNASLPACALCLQPGCGTSEPRYATQARPYAFLWHVRNRGV